MRIDKTAPTTTVKPTGTAGGGGWYRGRFSFSFAALDGLGGGGAGGGGSGVRATYFAIDNTGCSPTSLAACQTATGQVEVTGDGEHVITYFSVDEAGNFEALKRLVVKLDGTPPTLDGIPTAQPNEAGWYRGDVTIDWTCADALSGLDGACPPDGVITGEGRDLSLTASVADIAGNVARKTVSGVNIDRTPPTIEFVGRTPPPNAHGWNNTDVTLTWRCADALSGVVEATVARTIATEGAGQSATGNCVDRAGNAASDSQTGINIDKTKPGIALVGRAPAPNAAGWNMSEVTVTWRCSDTLAGVVDATVAATVTAEGASQSATGTCQDKAGNTAADTQMGINIDRTAPRIELVSRTPANAAGWNNTDVVVVWRCVDAASGPVEPTISKTLTSEGANQSIIGTCTDKAGHNTSDTQTGINIDKTKPGIAFAGRTPAANAQGWNSGPVTLSWTCSDALSGPVAPTATQTVSGQGANQSATGTCQDKAGNTTSDARGGINIDATKPTVTLSAGTGPYTVDQSVAVSCTATDALSGVASTTLAGVPSLATCKAGQVAAYLFPAGTTTLTATATDVAGNVGQATATVTVRVTAQGLDALIRRFVANHGVAMSLAAKADAIATAPNASAKAGALTAFVSEVNALRGRELTADQADVLMRLARAL